jgi:hypothetical protein
VFRGIVVFDRDVPRTVCGGAPHPGDVQVSEQRREIGIEVPDALQVRPGEGEMDVGVLEQIVDVTPFPSGQASCNRSQTLVPGNEDPFMVVAFGLLRPAHEREESLGHSWNR